MVLLVRFRKNLSFDNISEGFPEQKSEEREEEKEKKIELHYSWKQWTDFVNKDAHGRWASTPTSSLQSPDITAAHFEIKSGFIQMLPLFYRLSTEDPYKHLDDFIEIFSTIRLQNFIEDAFISVLP